MLLGSPAFKDVQAGPKAGCDVDYGWLPGAAGSDKCYMLVKTDSRWQYYHFENT